MTHLNYLHYIRQQAIFLTENLTHTQFIEPLPILSQASIGKHLRHIIDVFESVAAGIYHDSLSFDKRSRNIEIENDRFLALETLTHWIERIESADLNKTITLVSNFSMEAEEVEMCTETTLGRELVYAIEHAIHHFAIIKIGIVHNFGIKVTDDFGVAPSTIRFHKKTGT